MYWPHDCCPGSQSGGAGTKIPQTHSTKSSARVVMELPVQLLLNAQNVACRTGKPFADSGHPHSHFAWFIPVTSPKTELIRRFLQHCEKRLLASSCLSVYLSVCPSVRMAQLGSHGRVFIKFYI